MTEAKLPNAGSPVQWSTYLVLQKARQPGFTFPQPPGVKDWWCSIFSIPGPRFVITGSLVVREAQGQKNWFAEHCIQECWVYIFSIDT